MARRRDYPFHKLHKSDFNALYPLFMLGAIACAIIGLVALMPFVLPVIYLFKNDKISGLYKINERHKIRVMYFCSILTVLTPIACLLFYIYSKEEFSFIGVLWVDLLVGPFFKLIPSIFKGDNDDACSSINKMWKNAFYLNSLLNLCPYMLFIINPEVGITTRLNDTPWALLLYLLFFTFFDLAMTITFKKKLESKMLM